MIGIFICLLLAVYFCVISLRANKYRPEERTVKITKPLSVIINLSPLIGIVIFAVLFAFVLKGRLAKRATHAFLVFAIWIYATKFYQYILAYYKKKEILAGSLIGMGLSIISAAVFTPLDRYVSLIYADTDWCSVFLGAGLYIVFYAAVFAAYKKAKECG